MVPERRKRQKSCSEEGLYSCTVNRNGELESWSQNLAERRTFQLWKNQKFSVLGRKPFKWMAVKILDSYLDYKVQKSRKVEFRKGGKLLVRSCSSEHSFSKSKILQVRPSDWDFFRPTRRTRYVVIVLKIWARYLNSKCRNLASDKPLLQQKLDNKFQDNERLLCNGLANH